MPIYLDSISASACATVSMCRFVPVYVRDHLTRSRAQAAYATGSTPPSRRTDARSNATVLSTHCALLLDSGIVDQETYQEVRSGRLPAIRFIHDNTAMTMPTSTISFRPARLMRPSTPYFNEEIPPGYRAHGHVAVSCQAT